MYFQLICILRSWYWLLQGLLKHKHYLSCTRLGLAFWGCFPITTIYRLGCHFIIHGIFHDFEINAQKCLNASVSSMRGGQYLRTQGVYFCWIEIKWGLFVVVCMLTVTLYVTGPASMEIIDDIAKFWYVSRATCDWCLALHLFSGHQVSNHGFVRKPPRVTRPKNFHPGAGINYFFAVRPVLDVLYHAFFAHRSSLCDTRFTLYGMNPVEFPCYTSEVMINADTTAHISWVWKWFTWERSLTCDCCIPRARSHFVTFISVSRLGHPSRLQVKQIWIWFPMSNALPLDENLKNHTCMSDFLFGRCYGLVRAF